jgi:hypothetical protein
MSRLLVVCWLLATVLTCFASTNNKPPASNSQAVSYAAQSIAALTGGNAVSDVTLTGTVTWTAGSDTETGTATLLALGNGESRMNLALSAGTRAEIRDASTGTPLGKWITQNNASGMFAFHNCQTDAVWFFPVLGSLAGGSNVVFSYIGLESRNGENMQHIQSYVYQLSSSSGSSTSLQQLSTMDFYLDATTLLPSAVVFNAHPDNNSGANISVEVDFSNYQAVGGITVPMHIQKYVQGTLAIDVTVSSAVFNTGLALSNFSVN